MSGVRWFLLLLFLRLVISSVEAVESNCDNWMGWCGKCWCGFGSCSSSWGITLWLKLCMWVGLGFCGVSGRSGGWINCQRVDWVDWGHKRELHGWGCLGHVVGVKTGEKSAKLFLCRLIIAAHHCVVTGWLRMHLGLHIWGSIACCWLESWVVLPLSYWHFLVPHTVSFVWHDTVHIVWPGCWFFHPSLWIGLLFLKSSFNLLRKAV